MDSVGRSTSGDSTSSAPTVHPTLEDLRPAEVIEEGVPLGALPSPLAGQFQPSLLTAPSDGGSTYLPRRQSGRSDGSEYGGSAISRGERGSAASRTSGGQRRKRSSILGTNSNASNLTEIGRHVSNSFQLSFDIVRALSTVDQLVYCQICREYANKTNTFKLTACGHRFCKGCLIDWLELKVKEGQVYPACFHCDEDKVQPNAQDAVIPPPCAKSISASDIKALVHSEVWLKYEKFKFNKENKNARSCPYCDSTELGDPARPLITCTKCGKPFCYFHANAHIGKTCTEYERIMHEENLTNQALISSIAKPCPGCAFPVEKAGGCNQMKCYNCGKHFCWLCGKVVDGGTFPDHFQWWNVVNGCPNMQMQENVAPPSERAVKAIKALSIIQIIFIGPIATVLSLAFYLLGLPCILCQVFNAKQGRCQVFRTHFINCISFWGNTVVLILCIPLVVAFIVILFLVTAVHAIVSAIVQRFAPCCGCAELAERLGTQSQGRTDSIADLEDQRAAAHGAPAAEGGFQFVSSLISALTGPLAAGRIESGDTAVNSDPLSKQAGPRADCHGQGKMAGGEEEYKTVEEGRRRSVQERAGDVR